MLHIGVSVCVYSGEIQTKYDINTGIKPDAAYDALKTAYIAGIRDKKGRLLAAGIFISSLDNKKDPRLAEVAHEMFSSHKPTKDLVKKLYSIPLSRLRINLENGTVQQAFSDFETDLLYADFYLNHSIDGHA